MVMLIGAVVLIRIFSAYKDPDSEREPGLQRAWACRGLSVEVVWPGKANRTAARRRRAALRGSRAPVRRGRVAARQRETIYDEDIICLRKRWSVLGDDRPPSGFRNMRALANERRPSSQ